MTSKRTNRNKNNGSRARNNGAEGNGPHGGNAKANGAESDPPGLADDSTGLGEDIYKEDAKYDSDSRDGDLIADANEAFREAVEAENENRERALSDLRFARLGQQWPADIVKQRQEEGRPMLTVNRLPAFIRQVVNDARQNKPTTKTRPVDSQGDIETAEIYNGIIRHIEYTSSADIAYDTAIDSAVSCGWGYWRIGLDHSHDDTFDLELKIEAVPDPFTIYGDPWATSADGSDWMSAFVVERMSHKKFERLYPGAEKVNWSSDGGDAIWLGSDWVQVAEWWVREEIMREIVELSDGTVVAADRLGTDDALMVDLETRGVTPVEGRRRTVPSYRVKQCIVSDSEVLEQRDWPGKSIPIIPVYGDEVNEEGKRHFRSLIHDAIDPQRQFNYWRTAATELLALAPKAPFIGPKKAFAADPEAWATANIRSHPYLAYDGQVAPQRQQLDSSALGAIQQAMAASDDMKAVTGLFDAALGAPGNETSGRAIIARQREGDTSTFHFIDNLTRSIRQSGRILIDLIPHVWPDERIVRLMGTDGNVTEQKVNAPVPVIGANGRPVMEPDPKELPQPGKPPKLRPKTRTFSLTQGRYDLTATAGPSYTTKREEAAGQMIELLRAIPQSAPLIGDIIARNLDWPGADEIADRLKSMLPAQAQGGMPPQIKKTVADGAKLIAALQVENQKLKERQGADAAKLAIDKFEAETKRLETLAKLANTPGAAQAMAAAASANGAAPPAGGAGAPGSLPPGTVPLRPGAG
ncbi:MAG: portal protein [Alphaproteobacteria bacterium]